MKRGRNRTALPELRENGYRDADGRYQLSDGLQPWHRRIVDHMLLNPNSKIKDVAEAFEVTPQWMGQVLKTDAFREYYTMRMEEHQGFMHAQVVSKVQGVAIKSLDELGEKLDKSELSFTQLRDTADMALKSLGFGSQQGGVSVQVPGGQESETLIAVRSTTVRRAREAWQKRNAEKGEIETDQADYEHITAAMEKTPDQVDDAVLLPNSDEED